MYREWIKNIEDLTYKRTNKLLLDSVNKVFKSLTQDEATSGIDTTNLDPKLTALISKATNAQDDFSGLPDIMARTALDKVLKVFHESINDVYFGDLMKFVFNTGRYGNGQKVRVDTIPFLIDKKDKEMQKVLLTGNNLLEKTIDDAVKSSLSKPIQIKLSWHECDDGVLEHNYYWTDHFNNYIEGNLAEDINQPEQCSVFRGNSSTGSTLVEADRAYSLDAFQTDSGMISPNKLGINYGQHSPYNVDFSDTPLKYKKDTTPNKLAARFPLLDVVGSVARTE